MRCLRLRELAAAAVLIAAPLFAAAARDVPSSGQSVPATTSDFPTLSARAEAARDAGRLDEAAPLYRKALAVRPGWKEGWWALGTILYDQESHAAAARAFRHLVELDPQNGTAHLMLALCEYEVHRDASAMEHIQTAKKLGVQKDGELPHVLSYHEAMLLLRGGRYERALEVLQSLVAAGVDEDSLHFGLGLGVLLMRPNDAPLEGSPGREVVLRAGRAERHHLAKEFDAARLGYRTLVQEFPTFPNVHYAYGRFLLATADLDEGVAEFLKEITNSPGHVRARMQIAAARYRVDSAAGVPFAAEVVKLEPRYPFGHYLLGLLYFDIGDIGRAIPELEAAARMVPQEAQFQFTLGNAYARAGRKEAAARARAEFIRLKGKGDANSRPRLDLDGVSMPDHKH